MKSGDKHYKFINSSTGYVIYYYTITGDMQSGDIDIELEKIRAQVASQNGIMMATVYWEEVKDSER